MLEPDLADGIVVLKQVEVLSNLGVRERLLYQLHKMVTSGKHKLAEQNFSFCDLKRKELHNRKYCMEAWFPY